MYYLSQMNLEKFDNPDHSIVISPRNVVVGAHDEFLKKPWKENLIDAAPSTSKDPCAHALYNLWSKDMKSPLLLPRFGYWLLNWREEQFSFEKLLISAEERKFGAVSPVEVAFLMSFILKEMEEILPQEDQHPLVVTATAPAPLTFTKESILMSISLHKNYRVASMSPAETFDESNNFNNRFFIFKV